MKKDKRITFSEEQIKAAQEECGHKVEKLDNFSSTGAKVIGGCTAIAFWVGILGHVWGFYILGWVVLIAFAIILKPFLHLRRKKSIMLINMVVISMENAMVHNAITFEAIYNNLKLGIDWKKVASCRHAEQWCDASAYFRRSYKVYNDNCQLFAYPIPSWFSDDVNPETWFKSQDAFYKHYYKVICAYKALPDEARDDVFPSMVKFIEISQDILCNACLYLAALQRGNDSAEYKYPSRWDIDSMLECAYKIYEACNLKIKY